MSQTVKISAGYSDKTSENYNSSQYSLNLELDVVVNGSTTEIESASQKLFALCRKLVLAQRSVNVDTLLNREPSLAVPGANQNAPAASQSPSSSPQKLASAKQIRFLLELAKKAGMDEASIRSLPTEYQKSSFEALSSSEASKLIDSFSKKKAA
jgi:hypothetical protein